MVCPHHSALAPGACWPSPLGLLLGFQHNEHLLLLETGMGLQGFSWPGVTRYCLGPSFRVCTQGAVQQVDGLRQAYLTFARWVKVGPCGRVQCQSG